MEIVLKLVLNTTLLISICIIFNIYYQQIRTQRVYFKVLGGVILGITGIMLMTISVKLPNNVIFDTRSILISISGLFYGLLPTSIAAIIIVLYRIYLGGPGVITGVAVTLCSAIIGILWGRIRGNPEKLSKFELYSFGMVTHVFMILCMFLLPSSAIAETLKIISIPVLIIYPVGTLALALIITYERKSLRTEKLLNASELRFQKVCEQAPVGIIVESNSIVSYVNAALSKILDMSKTELMTTSWKAYTHPDDIGKDTDLFESMIAGDIDQYDLIKRYLKPDKTVIWVHLYIAMLNRAEIAEQSDYICIIEDITEQIGRENALFESERKHRELSVFLETMLDSIPDLVFYKDKSGVYLGCNRAFELTLGITKSELHGKNDYELYERETAERFVASDFEVISDMREVRSEETVEYPDGNRIITETLKTPFYHEEGEIAGLIGISRDITDRKKKEDKIEYLNIHDVMTGLYSRLHFDTELYRVDAASELPYSVITGDINALKLTNDLFGHSEGDKLIIETADVLRQACPACIIARTGGDEFSILLPQTNEAQAITIVAQINNEVEKRKKQTEGRSYFLSISLGYATKTSMDQTISELLKTAEEHMYRRKLLEHQSIRSTLLSTIKELLFSKSIETVEHAERMAELAKLMGNEVKLSDADLVSLELMATLHDVGKIGISAYVLSKPSQLDETEWTEIRRHPEIGYRIALTIPELQGIAGYILCHHERWDGGGYPQGLSGEDIPFISRLISVIDAFDAMTEDRPYRKAMTIEAAAAEIVRNAGTQFDPHISRVFVEQVLGLPFDD